MNNLRFSTNILRLYQFDISPIPETDVIDSPCETDVIDSPLGTNDCGSPPELIDIEPIPERKEFPDTYKTMPQDFDEASVLTRLQREQNKALQKMSDKDLLRLSIESLHDGIREHFSSGSMESKLDDIGNRIVMYDNDFNGEEISIMAFYMTEKRKPGFMHNECCFRIALRNSSDKNIQTGLRGFESGTEYQTGIAATMDTIIRIVNEIKLQPNFVN